MTMMFQQSVLFTVLAMHSSLIEAGHHRIQHEHEMVAEMASKSGKANLIEPSKSETAHVKLEHSMVYEEDDDEVSYVYTGKAGKDIESNAAKEESTTKTKSGKSEETEIMSMTEEDHEEKEIVVHGGKAQKMSVKDSKSDKHGMVDMKEDEDLSVVYVGRPGTASDSKAGKSEHLMDAKAGKVTHVNGKSGKASYSMSMADDDMTDDKGEWVPITTTEAAITTVSESPAVPAAEDTAAEDTASTLVQSTVSAETTEVSQLPFERPDREQVLKEELMLLQEGSHGGEGHDGGEGHVSKTSDTVTISNKIASGNHLRPDAFESQSSESAFVSVSRYSVLVACLASFYVLSL